MELRPFENQSEKRTRRILEIETEDTRYWLNGKTRLEEVFSPGAGDTTKERRFLRDAHFDYTLHKQTSDKVVWAFEFDGPTHTSDPETIRRDILKNKVCAKANLPLLRIEDDLLEAVDGISLLGWLIRRWMAYEKIMPRMASDCGRAASAMSDQDWEEFRISQNLFAAPPELDAELLFNLDKPYPPLPKISARLLKTYGIMDGLSLELNPNWRELDTEAEWELWTEDGPDLADHGLYSRSFCNVELRHAREKVFNKPIFSVTAEYMARMAYPTFPNQCGILDPDPETGKLGFCGPPYGGSLWAVGPMIARYRALKEVEKWASKNLRRKS